MYLTYCSDSKKTCLPFIRFICNFWKVVKQNKCGHKFHLNFVKTKSYTFYILFVICETVLAEKSWSRTNAATSFILILSTFSLCSGRRQPPPFIILLQLMQTRTSVICQEQHYQIFQTSNMKIFWDHENWGRITVIWKLTLSTFR